LFRKCAKKSQKFYNKNFPIKKSISSKKMLPENFNFVKKFAILSKNLQFSQTIPIFPIVLFCRFGQRFNILIPKFKIEQKKLFFALGRVRK